MTVQQAPLRITVASASAIGLVMAVLVAVRDIPPPDRARELAQDAQTSSLKARSAETTQLFDGTPASRFNPVSEHAQEYDWVQRGSRREAYHVARLVGVDTDGSTQLCGRAEVKHENTWGSICFRGWTQADANMFCKTMGLTGGTARYNDGLGKPTWDDTAVTHADLNNVMQRAQWGRGTDSDPPLQDDGPVIWMTEVQCEGNEGNILDCPFGGKPGEGTLGEDVVNTWVDYNNNASNCDASSQVGLCCDVSEFCPPRSVWNPEPADFSHEGEMFMSQMSPQQMAPEMIANCKCDKGFYMVASSVYAGRCQACPKGSCSAAGSTSIDDCYCLEGFYKDASGECAACPTNACSPRGAKALQECNCFEGFYMSGDACVACPEGKTTSSGNATSEDECSVTCGLPHSSDAGDNADTVVSAAAAIAAADAAMKQALAPYIKAVNDEKAAQTALDVANAFTPPAPPTYAHIHSSQSYTGKTDMGDHATYYLDRQTVACGSVPIQQVWRQG